jgi:hypothetical protein
MMGPICSSWQVADFKNTGLFALNQEHGFVTDFGLHGGRHRHFVHALGSRLGRHSQLDVHGGLLLNQQDGGGIGLLQRSLFQVNALDLENGLQVLRT